MNQKLNLRNILLLSGLILAAMFAISAYVWGQIPAGEQVCIHWNAAGVCDDYGNKFTGIFLMPLISVGLVGLFAVIPRIEPRASHIVQSRKAYVAVWTMMLIFLLGFHIVLMLNLLGRNVNIGTFAPLLVGIMFIVIGNYLGKVQSNFMFGIRTPWTLSSDLSWNKTHRLGGKLFVLIGVLFIITNILTTGELWVYVMMGSIVVMLVVLTAYSYLVWKSDPEAHML